MTAATLRVTVLMSFSVAMMVVMEMEGKVVKKTVWVGMVVGL